MSDLSKFRRLRTINKKSTLSLIEKTKDCMANFEKIKNSFEDLTSLRDTLIEKISKIQSMDDEISELIPDDDELLLEIDEATDFTLNARKHLNIINNFLEQSSSKTTPSSPSPPEVNNKSYVKLPQLKLSSFDGKQENWQTFFENFICAIDNNENLSSVQKFTYLRNLVKGQALDIITGIKLTNENYQIALDLLKERYNDKQQLISSHVKALLSIKKVSNIQNISGIRKICDYIEIQIRSLNNLGITANMYGPLLIPVLMDKLPNELKVILSREFIKEDAWDFEKALKILQVELKARKNIQADENFSYADEVEPSNPFTAETLYTAAKKFETKKKPLCCLFCNKEHKCHECDVVKDVSKRIEILRQQRRCPKCLRFGHDGKQCRRKFKCFSCSGPHHAAVCDSAKESNSEIESSASVAGVSSTQPSSVLLQTASTVATNRGFSRFCRILFDSGSQLSYVSPVLREHLKLKTVGTKLIKIKTFGNQSISEKLDEVQISLKTKSNSFITISCFVKDICAPISGQFLELAVENHSHLIGLDLADSNINNKKLDIDLLIGADFYWDMFENDFVKGDSGPVAIKSKFGYVLGGPIVDLGSQKNCSVLSSHILEVHSEFVDHDLILNESLKHMWGDDEVEVECRDVYDEFQKTIKFDRNLKRYEVELPFKNDKILTSDNYSLCVKRLNSLGKKFKNNVDLLNSYNEIIKDQLAKGVIERVEQDEIDNGNVHYLPHRAVVNEKKSTTKVRMVFDASAKSLGSPSLNDCLHSGPNLATPLLGVLLRFRSRRIAFTADIEKAFLQIGLTKKHRDLVRFLWYDDLNNIDVKSLDSQNIAVFRLCRVLFGVTSSPFLLNGTLKIHAQKYENIDREFVEKLLSSLHVDDLISGADELNEAHEFFNVCKTRLLEGGFHLRKFESNSEDLEKQVLQNELSSETLTKVLGLLWDKKNDQICFSFIDLVKNQSQVPTKRQVLKFIASIFDPLGLINPFVVRCKILFQKLCVVDKLSWDDNLGGESLVEWQDILSDISSISLISIDRWHTAFTNSFKIELHGFSDASLKAYGACVYLRCNSGKFFCSTLIASKSRVAPVGKTTIPRLELRATLLLSELLANVLKELSTVHKIESVTCWTDSTICIHWINNVNKYYETFVQNRLEKIRNLFDINHWKYIETWRNPADILSRGTTLTKLKDNLNWFKGPEFLYNISVEWPIYQFVEHYNNFDSDESLTFNASNDYVHDLSFIKLDGFNTYQRLLRVTAWVIRFVENLKSAVKRSENSIKINMIQPGEVDKADKMWIRTVQKDVMQAKTYKQLRKDLRLFEDADGIIRCKGRLQNAPLDYGAKYPIFIPSNSYFGKLIILHFHVIVKHNGVKETLNEVRSKFWIPKARNIIKSVIHRCFLCRRFEGMPYRYPISPPLPLSRLNDDHCFKYTAVDYAGPLFIRLENGRELQGKSKNSATSKGKSDNLLSEKGKSSRISEGLKGKSDDSTSKNVGGKFGKYWIFLYTCASSRSLLLDLTPDCSATSCILSLRRFFARRGIPDEIRSDNGTQFTSDDTQRFVSSKGISWHFNVAGAPWWGGLIERLVQSTKRCLRKCLGRSSCTLDEVLTILTEIESVINNRPLTHTYEEPGDLPLTPNHLLFGRKINMEAKRSNGVVVTDVSKRNKHVETVLQHYWQRWRSEYLVNLREFHKSKRSFGTPIVSIEDVVLIDMPDTKRARWPIGVIQDVYHSRDGEIRSASVRYISTDGKPRTTTRPINKLYLLECAPEKHTLEIMFVDENLVEMNTF